MIFALIAFICLKVIYNMKHETGLMDWNRTSEIAKKRQR